VGDADQTTVPPSAPWWKKALRIAAVVLPIGIVVAVVVAFFALDLQVSGSDESTRIGPSFPPGGPAEFLYLDSARVATYLAQVDGGTVESEKLTRKLTESLSAKISLEKAGEAGASQSVEAFAERTLKPTAASSFFALRAALVRNEVIRVIRPRFFQADVEDLPEGQFVTFRTSALLPPIYTNAYLAVRNAYTVAAIFPGSPARRKVARKFFKKVGENPRMVFALQPYVTRKEQKLVEFDAELEGKAKGEQAPKPVMRRPYVYLLPLSAQLLSGERSLIKYGGGRFTVVGKLIRSFPEPTHDLRPAYVDSATLETWEQTIKQAPGDLLCRTAPNCDARRLHLSGVARKRAIRTARKSILHALETQTRIQRKGAVILPVAIYK
jgi:hypothetical protein